MTDMTRNTIVFSGTCEEIKNLNKFLEITVNNYWGTLGELLVSDHGTFSTLKMVLDTPCDPPLEELNNVYQRFPTLDSVHRLTKESDWYKTTVVRREPERGFQRCLIDDPHGIRKNGPSFEVLDEYLMDLRTNERLCTTSRMVGITEERIVDRKSGRIPSI